MMTDDELLALAGKAAFARGRTYFADGRIALSEQGPDAIVGEAEGSEIYEFWLKRDGADWSWDCVCPAADGGAFCKHLVAAVLTAREEAQQDGDAEAEVDEEGTGDAGQHRKAKSARRGAGGSGDLGAFLRAQSPERLAAWLLALAEEDAAIAKRLALYRAADDPAELKSALGKMLDPGGFLDYRRSNAYARRLDAVIVQLQDAITRDADAGRALCEYAIARLLKIYARSDDSGGSIGDQLHVITALHARACAAAPPGKAFAKVLLRMQQDDDWGLFPLAAYWDTLGAAGQADYGKRVLAEFESLEPTSIGPDRSRSGAFGAIRRIEAFARACGDFELLQRVLRRDLSHPHDHLRVLESLIEFRRPREALAWAEQAVREFPEDVRLRAALADCLVASGLDAEAAEQAWQAFRLHPLPHEWDRLKRISQAQWPAWRERALAEVAARERGEASHRASLLDHDGDVDAAVALARTQPIRADVLEKLARRIEPSQPTLAGDFYLRIIALVAQNLSYSRYPEIVRLVGHATRCVPDRRAALLAQIRAEHGKKSRLMQLLADAGL